MFFLSKLFVGVVCPWDERILIYPTLGWASHRLSPPPRKSILSLATVIFLSAPPLLAQTTPLPSVPDATFSTLSRRGTPKDILHGGGKRHACLTKANRRHRVNHNRPTR
jgi:hypothetical protein